MSQRGMELYAEALEYAYTTIGKDHADTSYFHGIVAGKFSALIVQECINIVAPTSHHNAWAQSYLGGVDGLELLDSKIRDIKKHFGVEE